MRKTSTYSKDQQIRRREGPLKSAKQAGKHDHKPLRAISQGLMISIKEKQNDKEKTYHISYNTKHLYVITQSKSSSKLTSENSKYYRRKQHTVIDEVFTIENILTWIIRAENTSVERAQDCSRDIQHQIKLDGF